ncbi:hypothetical protein N8Z59_03680 [Planktomarina temperata]|nr:hypothetical protein [Planktomarina temperata]
MQLSYDIEKHLTNSIVGEPYLITDPTQLIINKRFDLGFKLAWLNNNETNVRYYSEMYLTHIAAITDFKNSEFNNSKKNHPDDFVREFYKLEESMSYGFQKDVSLLPINSTGVLLNGSHRSAIAIKNSQAVYAICVDQSLQCYDFSFFVERGLNSTFLDSAANELCKYCSDVRIAIRWPRAGSFLDNEISKLFPQLLYEKQFNLKQSGARHLVKTAYDNEEWASSTTGLQHKVDEILGSKSIGQIYVFRCSDEKKVREIKSRIRALYDIDKHSIHITDTHQEVLNLAQILLHQQTLDHLNSGLFDTQSTSINTKLSLLTSFKQNKPQLDFVIDRSFVLELMGVRKSNDVDLITMAEDDPNDPHGFLTETKKALKYHEKTAEELILDPNNYFFYLGFKLVLPEIILKYKIQRSEPKDLEDIKHLTALLQNFRSTIKVNHMASRIRYTIYRTRQCVLHILQIFGLKQFLKKVLSYK